MIGIVTPLGSDGASWDCCRISLKSKSGSLMGVPINCGDISLLPGVVVPEISQSILNLIHQSRISKCIFFKFLYREVFSSLI